MQSVTVKNSISRTIVFTLFLLALSGAALAAATEELPPPRSADTAGPPPGSASARASAPVSNLAPRSFATLTDAELWTYVKAAHREVIVGLKKPGMTRGVWKNRVLVDSATLSSHHNQLRALPGISIINIDSGLPFVELTVAGVEQLHALRALPSVDYVEPRSFKPMLQSNASSGCYSPWDSAMGGMYWNQWTSPIDTIDLGGNFKPWNYDYANIPAAWLRASGKYVKVGVIDTGVFREQSHLHMPGFIAGASNNPYRRIDDYNDTSDSHSWDECGHGTRMAGTIAAPRDHTAQVVGVAWGASIIASKSLRNVLLESTSDSEIVAGIRETVYYRGANIVAMAYGDIFYHSAIADMIRYVFYDGTYVPSAGGVLFIGAAGTTACQSGVVFPARMPEVMAVAGVTPDGKLHRDSCGGPQVSVSATIGKEGESSEVPAPGRGDGDVIHFGGSSAATAQVAGVAALVWSRYPWFTRDQVRARLESTTGHLWDRKVGFGQVDANAAVGGFQYVSFSSTDVTPFSANIGTVPPYTFYTITAVPVGDGPFTYRWDGTGETTPTVTRVSGALGTTQYSGCAITDTVEHRALSAVYGVSSDTPPPPPPPCHCCGRRICACCDGG